jgi:putative ABC transport system substrate-binding protein
VFALAVDPVGIGVAASLSRPGGNATGLTTLAGGLGAKRLELIKEAFPRAERVVVLFVPDDVTSFPQMKEIEEAAPRLKMRVIPIEWRQAGDIEPAFKRGAKLGAQAYMITQSFLSNSQRQVIVDRLLRSKIPAIYHDDRYPEAGGLMGYGPSSLDNFRRAAAYVDKIFKGAKPGDLPIEQPTRFELVLNLKTAKAMGIKFPQSFLVRADRVIE